MGRILTGGLIGFGLLALAACSDSGGGQDEPSGPLTAIDVSPQDGTVQKNGTLQFTATGTYQDGSTQDLTDSVEWFTTRATVAAIGSGGLATGVNCGLTIISALDPATVIGGSTGLSTVPCTSEGSTVSPVPLTLSTPYAGEVGTGTSYYSVAVPITNNYTVTLTGHTDDVDVGLFDDALFTSPLGFCFVAGRLTEEFCRVTTVVPGTLYISVSGSDSTAGSSFTLKAFITPTATGVSPPPADQGRAAIPIELPDQMVVGRAYRGQVGTGNSYYTAGVLPGVSSRVSLIAQIGGATPLDDNVDLLVYEDSGFAVELCSSANAGTADESCAAPAPGNAVWIQADSQGVGTYFDLLLLTAEGTQAEPIGLFPNKDNYGTVDDTTSYYRFAVTNGVTYTVQFVQMTGDLTLKVFGSDGTFGSSACTQDWAIVGRSPVGTPCVWSASGGSMYVAVTSRSTVGVFFDLKATSP